VNWNGGACRKYRQLADEVIDRELTPKEKQFYDAHQMACDECREYETQGAFALNMLRTMDFDAPDTSKMTDRIVRRVRLQTIRGGLKFWTPALGGMAIGALMMMAVLQLVGQSNVLPRNSHTGGDAKRIDRAETVFPELER
jgi:predicted anti-sigma-YlaC factor YlaD